MIQSLIFDLGKVLVPFDFTRAFEKLAPLGRYKADEIAQQLFGIDLFERLESGRVEPEEFRLKLNEMLGTRCEADELGEIFGSIFDKETLIPESTIAALHKRYRMVLLSNTNAIHFRFLQREYPILTHFDEHVLSHRVGALKPSPKMYEAAIAAAQCEPQKCFYTDDIPAYVEAAKTHGIDAVVFQNREQIESELRRRGVEW